MIDVFAFVIDDENAEKFWAHGITERQVLDLLDGSIAIYRNRQGRRASHLIIGRDRSGMCLAVPIEPTHDPVVWRPITAWPCKDSERSRLPRER
jgi:hypothetical protein